jgi:ABC-type antimicrobial peptide transport system permease subunit
VMESLVARLAAFFGAMALFMAAIGLYGVLSYSTGQRTSEIAIRMALGATGWTTVRMILGEAAAMVSIGTVIGLAGALAAGRLISSQLFGLSPADPLPPQSRRSLFCPQLSLPRTYRRGVHRGSTQWLRSSTNDGQAVFTFRLSLAICYSRQRMEHRRFLAHSDAYRPLAGGDFFARIGGRPRAMR